MKIRNVALGAGRFKAFAVGDVQLRAIYNGEVMVYGGEDDTLNAADYGLTTDEGTPIYYVNGSTFGNITKVMDFASNNYNFDAWGGYKTPDPTQGSGIYVYRYSGLAPAVYAYGSANLYHYGVQLPKGLWFVIDSTTLVQGHMEPDGASFSWRTAWRAGGGDYPDGGPPVMFRGPYGNATLYTNQSSTMYGGYYFRRAGSPISSYISSGAEVSVNFMDTGTMSTLWGGLIGNAGKNLVF